MRVVHRGRVPRRIPPPLFFGTQVFRAATKINTAVVSPPFSSLSLPVSLRTHIYVCVHFFFLFFPSPEEIPDVAFRDDVLLSRFQPLCVLASVCWSSNYGGTRSSLANNRAHPLRGRWSV